MRTTLTLDDDLALKLKEKAHKSGKPFKVVVNMAIREGLRRPAVRPKPYRVKPVALGGVQPGVDLDRALRLAEALEDEAIARKLELRK